MRRRSKDQIAKDDQVRRAADIGAEWARRKRNADALDWLAENYWWGPGDYMPVSDLKWAAPEELYTVLFRDKPSTEPDLMKLDFTSRFVDWYTPGLVEDFWGWYFGPFLDDDHEHHARVADTFIRTALQQWEDKQLREAQRHPDQGWYGCLPAGDDDED